MARIPLKQINQDPEKHAKGLRKAPLRTLLETLDEAYHLNHKPMVSDAVYEQLKDVYRKRFPNDVYTKQVGIKSTRGDDVRLPNYMPSLTKVKPNTPQLERFLDPKAAYCITDKLDGISLQIVYEGGKPVEAYTRHDGTMGKDVSRHIPHLKIPKKVSTTARFAVRAEAIIKVASFNKDFSKESGGAFTAARNFVGGTINNLKGNVASRFKAIDIVCFAVLEGPASKQPQSKQHIWMKRLGFTVVQGITLAKDVDQYVLSELHSGRIKKSRYEIDGLVVTRNISSPKMTASNPQHARAFKENSEEDMRDVVVTEIRWDISRGNVAVPVAHFAPVKVPGATVSKALAHSLFYLEHGYKKGAKDRPAKKLPINVGATIRIVRSGKVIPYIVEVLKPAKNAAVPDFPYERQGVHAVATEETDRQRAKAITHFFRTIDIEGMRLATVEKLMDYGFEDLLEFLVDLEAEDFDEIPRLGAKTGKKIVDQIQAKRKAGFDFVTIAEASNIMRGFSKGRLESIYSAIPTILKERATRSLVTRIQEIEGFKEIAVDFVKALPKLRRFIKENKLKIVRPKKRKASGAKMKDHRISFTGVRDKDLQAWIESQGGQVQNMKNDTTILVTKDGYSSSKTDKANDKGITVMGITEFKDKFSIT